MKRGDEYKAHMGKIHTEDAPRAGIVENKEHQ
jgi:hypothetical protein